MHFGKKILTLQYEPWAPYYLDYNSLKQILEAYNHDRSQQQQQRQQQEQEEQNAVSKDDDDDDAGMMVSSSFQDSSSSLHSWSRWSSKSAITTRLQHHQHPVTEEFLYMLQVQVEKVVLFYLQEKGRIAYELVENRQFLWQVSTDEQYLSLEERYYTVSVHLLHLIKFVELNVTAIRKILKKHDKYLNAKLSRFILTSSSSHIRGNLLLQPLLSEDDGSGALIVSLETGLDELKQYRQPLEEDSMILTRTPPGSSSAEGGVRVRRHHARSQTAPAIPNAQQQQQQQQQMRPLPPPPHSSFLLQRQPSYKSSWSVHSSPAPQQQQTKTVIIPGSARSYNDRKRYNSPSSSLNQNQIMTQQQHDQQHILFQINAARRRLQQTNEFVQLLAAPMMTAWPSEGDREEEEMPEEEVEEEGALREFGPYQFLSNTLNLLSTFLYMTNYYIVAPTSGSYAERLGGSTAMASMIIGMTPVAALASTVLYSWWTSHSYKSALLFASTCSMIGNLLYAAGLPRNSLRLVMIGRLLNGFGSARSINRRYICDTYPLSERTAASAAFVTAGALGMSAGPGIASFLHYWVAKSADNKMNLYWQAENAPGWFMFVVWALYLIFIMLYFQDPPSRKESVTIELTGETQPLLVSNGSKDVPEERAVIVREPPIWRNIPVMLTFFIYFVLKAVLEGILSSSATLTQFYFGWSASLSGMYLAVLGLLMLPANLAVSVLARMYDDRELIVAMQVLVLAGCLAVLQWSGSSYSVFHYVIGSFLVFLSTNALEGPNMSLLSKTIPRSWSKGIFNVGMLGTEAGTLGRAIADVFLTICGSGGLEYLLNRTFGSFSALSFVTLLASCWFYEHLEPYEKDDD